MDSIRIRAYRGAVEYTKASRMSQFLTNVRQEDWKVSDPRLCSASYHSSLGTTLQQTRGKLVIRLAVSSYTNRVKYIKLQLYSPSRRGTFYVLWRYKSRY